MTTSVRAAVGLAAVAALAGCGDNNPRTYAVPGKLTYADGRPVPGGATVLLQSEVNGKPVAARGMAGPDGSFKLTTFKDGDGVVAGDHKVAVVPLPPPDGAKPAKPAVPQRYGDFDTSGLTFSVAPDTQEMVITIDPTAAKRK